VQTLEWRQADFAAGTVRLDPGQTKNGDGRLFPMTAEASSCLPSPCCILNLRCHERRTDVWRLSGAILSAIARHHDEDVAICASVQRGLRSRAYDAARLSVRREAG
jgi:hypothetical protein